MVRLAIKQRLQAAGLKAGLFTPLASRRRPCAAEAAAAAAAAAAVQRAGAQRPLGCQTGGAPQFYSEAW